MSKCFEGIHTLKFNEDLEVLAMTSTEDEEVPLIEIISTSAARGQVEKWLIELETIMLKSVRHVVEQAILAFPTKPRVDWVLDWPGQTILCVGKTYWTLRIEEAMQDGVEGMTGYLNQCRAELTDIIVLVRGKLSKQNRITLGNYRILAQRRYIYIYPWGISFRLLFAIPEALVTLDVHGRDVLEELCIEKVIKNTDFKWLCHLRYYWLVRKILWYQ